MYNKKLFDQLVLSQPKMSSADQSLSFHCRDSEEKNEIALKNLVKYEKWFKFETQPLWINIISIIIFHIASIYFIITFSYLDYKVLSLWGIAVTQLSGLGITAGVHRLWTHRAYKAKLPLRIILAILYTSAGMNSIHDWVRDHRVHHKYTETNADPHNSNRGFWFAHVGWLFMKKHPDVYRRGATIDMNDVLSDPVVCFFDKYFLLLKILFCFVLPVAIPVYLLNQDLKMSLISQIFIRYPLVLNGTWSVNSFAHKFGYRPYDHTIQAAENVSVALMAMGEGWHNYHHTFPWDYRASEFGNIITNPTTCFINVFAKIGWAYDLKEASKEMISRRMESKNRKKKRRTIENGNQHYSPRSTTLL